MFALRLYSVCVLWTVVCAVLLRAFVSREKTRMHAAEVDYTKPSCNDNNNDNVSFAEDCHSNQTILPQPRVPEKNQ